MTTYEIHKLALNTDEIVDYDTAIEHIEEQIDEQMANRIIRYNSAGGCIRTAHMSITRYAANIAMEHLINSGMVKVSKHGVFSNGYWYDVCFGVRIKEVRE